MVASGGVWLTSTYIARTLLPYVVAGLGVEEAWVSRVLYVGLVVLALLSPLAGWLADQVGSRPIIALSSVVTALTVPLYAYSTSVAQPVALRMIHAAASTLGLVAVLRAAGTISSRGGVGLGVLRASQGLGIALGILLAGLLAVHLGAVG